MSGSGAAPRGSGETGARTQRPVALFAARPVGNEASVSPAEPFGAGLRWCSRTARARGQGSGSPSRPQLRREVAALRSGRAAVSSSVNSGVLGPWGPGPRSSAPTRPHRQPWVLC